MHNTVQHNTRQHMHNTSTEPPHGPFMHVLLVLLGLVSEVLHRHRLRRRLSPVVRLEGLQAQHGSNSITLFDRTRDLAVGLGHYCLWDHSGRVSSHSGAADAGCSRRAAGAGARARVRRTRRPGELPPVSVSVSVSMMGGARARAPVVPRPVQQAKISSAVIPTPGHKD